MLATRIIFSCTAKMTEDLEEQQSLVYYSDPVDKVVQGGFALCDRSDF